MREYDTETDCSRPARTSFVRQCGKQVAVHVQGGEGCKRPDADINCCQGVLTEVQRGEAGAVC